MINDQMMKTRERHSKPLKPMSNTMAWVIYAISLCGLVWATLHALRTAIPEV